MLTLSEREMIFKLSEGGVKPAQIARQLNRSIGAILKYKVLYERSTEGPPNIEMISEKITPFQEYIGQYWKLQKWNVSKLFEEIKLCGYQGTYALLNEYVHTWLAPKEKKYKRCVRVETKPGEQAQVDWGSFGEVRIGDRMERLYAFVYVLSYSRAAYVEFVVRQNQQTLQNCHIRAFKKLGIPEKIRYDNMKTVVIKREKLLDGTKRIHLNAAFKDFASYYGFEIDPCPPYWPRSKGKVEAGVKYVKSNFAQGKSFKRTFKNLDELQSRAETWQGHANNRIHRTTKVKPSERWLEEKPFLKFPGNLPDYITAPLLDRWSTKDGVVQYHSNIYSVPTPYSKKLLSIKEVSEHGLPILEIYYRHRLVAKHSVYPGRNKWIVNDEHIVGPPRQTPLPDGPMKKVKVDKIPDIQVSIRELDYYNVFNF